MITTLFFAPTIINNKLIINKSKKPHIIFIGIDSLRPDYVKKYGKVITPNIKDFTEKSINLEKVYTPLARTFPSWTSILTSQYPVNSGARFNLTRMADVKYDTSIAIQLKKDGYKTIWAQDERRFNNIDTNYGFETIVGPPADAAEFLISQINAIPTLSLFYNYTSVRYISPYLYNNRAAWWSYYPEKFIDDVLLQVDNNDSLPIFLNIHLTLPHWPFKSAVSKGYYRNNIERYRDMLTQVDLQFEYLINSLEKRNITKNSIIVLLSDHGESFGDLNDGLLPNNQNAELKTNSHGHGTNILSLSQNRVLTAIQDNRENTIKLRINNEKNYSLVDLSPTILTMLNLPLSPDLDGKTMTDNKHNTPIFLESSINPFAIANDDIDLVKTIKNSIDYYTIDENGKVIVKPELYNSMIKSKQRGIIEGNTYLVTLPYDERVVLVDLEQGKWSFLSSNDNKKKVEHMLTTLCEQYKIDVIKGVYSTCRDPKSYLNKIYSD